MSTCCSAPAPGESLKSAVMFGAGNVGRGFIGQLFNESGYRVVFVDIDTELVRALREQGGYRLETVFNDELEERVICPVTALDGAKEADAVARAVAGCGIAATAVGVRALPHVVPHIARGIEARAAAGTGPVHFIVCENMKNAAATVRAMVREALSADVRTFFEDSVGFVDTVIGRMVPIPTEEMRTRDVSLIRVEPYKELPVDRAGFVSAVPEISAMTTHDDFPVFTARKLYVHNCGHALLAYCGYLRGHAFGCEALADDDVRAVIDGGMAESSAGIAREYGADPAWLRAHAQDLIVRFGNRALGDTVFRLARDPIRKLGSSDRLVGAARVAETSGELPAHLAWGIAAALLFDHPDDPVAQDLQQRLAEQGAPAVLQDVAGIRPDEALGTCILRFHDVLRDNPLAPFPGPTA